MVVAEELSITRAAKRLGMQQSPLSRSLKRLQTDLGFSLLGTTGNRVLLTPEGQHMAIEARRLLQQVADLYVRTTHQGEGPRLRLSFTFSAGGQLPHLLALNRQMATPAVLGLSPVPPHEPSPTDGQVLIAPARLPLPGTLQHPLWEEPLLAALPSQDDYGDRSHVLLWELALLGPIYIPSDLSRTLDQVPRRVRFRDVAYLDAPTLRCLLLAGHCSALLPASLAPSLAGAGIVLTPVSDLAPVLFCAHIAQTSTPGLAAWVAALVDRLNPPLG